ncbi:hypothetical protein DRN93_02000 [archaeon]|nr:MAG: hypothetical protein DRN93_02000 [archaeon]HDN17570.1 hypothetical protein [Candidatus Bathyarchaeota archaeon]
MWKLFSVPPDLVYIVNFAIIWVISAIVLWLSAKIVKGEGSFLSCMILALLGSLVFSFFSSFHGLLYTLIAILAWLFLIKVFLNLDWGEAIVVAIVAWVLGLIVSAIFGIPLLI